LDEDVRGNRVADGFGFFPVDAFCTFDDEFETFVCKCVGRISCINVGGFEDAEVLTGGCGFD
jgi:hypothetical protein